MHTVPRMNPTIERRIANTETVVSIPLDQAAAHAIVSRGIERYIAGRRAMVPGFVDRHFSFYGSLRLHRAAIGVDLLRAPINIAASALTVGKNVLGLALRRAGWRAAAEQLDARSLFLPTALGCEIEWRVHTELLQLPFAQSSRRCERDALAEAILADPRLEAHFTAALATLGQRRADPVFRARATEAMAAYVGSRAAAADIVNNMLAAAVGLSVFHKATPGVATLSGAIATALAHKAAVSGFALGPWLGKLWYGAFSATTTPLLYAGVFAGLLVPVAALAAFAGVVADPVQRALGAHQRRLLRLIDTLELNLVGEEARLAVRDHYAARIFDLVDWTMMIARLARTS